jgi:NAD-dependent dihydropyrimidine dehydrogenase PreA subunit
MAIRTIDYEKCTNCGTCQKICPGDVFGKFGNFVYIARREDCITCFMCEVDCPADCIYVGPERERDVVLPFDPEIVDAYK